MLTKNLLIGGVATVGTVATAAVVTNQYGTPFSSKTNDPKKETSSPITVHSSNRQDANHVTGSSIAFRESLTVAGQEKAKERYREEVKKWLDENIGKDKWEVKIKKDSREEKFEESDLGALPKYLTDNTESLKLLAPETGTTTALVFENSDCKWKIIPSEEQITKWVGNASGNKATLKLAEEGKPKELKDVNDLDKLFVGLSNKKDVFKNITPSQPPSTKNILFEKIDNDWKHSKSEINGWLKNPSEENKNFEIKVKKDESNTTPLDSADENDLIGLFSYLKSGEAKPSISSFSTGKTTLTLGKVDGNWTVTGIETTIGK